MPDQIRCSRCLGHPDYIRYHDTERGMPLHDERKHFEMLFLETMQAGLSRWTILQRREAYRQAFANFDPHKIIYFNAVKQEELMQDSGIIRNRLKIKSATTNAQAFIKIQSEFGTFDSYIWGFTQRKIIKNSNNIQTISVLSDTITKDMKKRGFVFIGSTTVYARLQAIGIINDHSIDCFRYQEV